MSPAVTVSIPDTARRFAPAGALGDELRATRGELGLPGDRLVVMSGHQAMPWHPGILAKSIVADAIAASHGGVAAHLVVDQDINAAATVAVPVRGGDDRLGVAEVELVPQPADIATGWVPAAPPRPYTIAGAPPAAAHGLDAFSARLAERAQAANLAAQVTAGLFDLAAPWIDAPLVVSAGTLLATSAGVALRRTMADDPHACAEAYNRAIATAPGAAAPLLVRDDRVELPLWRLEPDGRRLRAYDDDLDRFADDVDRLRPRALLMTALVRLAACDLFIHGLGGADYDTATERWIADWLGLPLAPMGVASADLRLPHLAEDAPDERAATAAARRAAHDPESLGGGSSPGQRKKAWLDRIDAAPRRSAARREAFFAMHAELVTLRARHRDGIEAALETVDRAWRARADQRIAQRRDWAFFLHEPHAIDDLAARVRAAVPTQVS